MHFFALIPLLFVLLTSCAEPVAEKRIPAEFDRSSVVKVVTEIRQHAAVTQQNLNDRIQFLHAAGEAFINAPEEDTLAALKTEWRAAHLAYARAQFGILNQDPEQRELIFRIDAWPIQPGFIDDLPLYPESGIINDETLVLNAESMLLQHGITDEEEVALGFHSLEYLIFRRPLADFALNSGRVSVERRRLFLELALNQLVLDTEYLLASSRGQFDVADYAQAIVVLQQFLSSSLQKTRVAFRESNLLTTEDSGHSTYSGTSLETVRVEVEALNEFMLDGVSMGPVLQVVDTHAFGNLTATIAELRQLIVDGNDDEVSRANLPLLLSALTHQLESFDRMLVHRLPAN